MTVFFSPLAPEIRQTNGFVQFLAFREVQRHEIVIFHTVAAFSAICMCNN
jgi:hypothetical protein